MNGEKSADFIVAEKCVQDAEYPFQITQFPAVFFYYKGGNYGEPVRVTAPVSVFPLIDFVEDRLDGVCEARG